MFGFNPETERYLLADDWIEQYVAQKGKKDSRGGSRDHNMQSVFGLSSITERPGSHSKKKKSVSSDINEILPAQINQGSAQLKDVESH